MLIRSNDLFPKQLLAIKPIVKQLYVKGQSRPNLWAKTITVVGSRKMTRYGKQVVDQIVPELVKAGATIISGFMYGVDQYVHEVCLQHRGFTVAVLGWGIDWPVLPIEQKLYQKIESNGQILSEYTQATKPQLWMFPARDRIMAGLAQVTLVIEAAKQSGSLLTANFAKRYKRHLFSVPGPITSAVSSGTNQLIQSGQAIMATSAKDILTVLNWPISTIQSIIAPANYAKILDVLKNEPLLIDELISKLKLPAAKILSDLSCLQIQGQVFEDSGKYYIKQNAV